VALAARDLRHSLHALGHLRAREALGEDDAELMQLPQSRRRRLLLPTTAAGDDDDNEG
jgi:hypothetical protein